MLKLKGTPIYFTTAIPKDRVIKDNNDNFIINPYSGSIILLGESNGNYKEVFTLVGITNETIDACGDYALKKIKSC